MARQRHHTRHDARALHWPKRNLCVVEGWRLLMHLDAWNKALREVKPRRMHELERGVDVTQLRSGDAHQPAEEAIVVFKRGGRRRCRNWHASKLGTLLAHEVHPEKRVVARVHLQSSIGQIA
jgi:hypothetical protein